MCDCMTCRHAVWDYEINYNADECEEWFIKGCRCDGDLNANDCSEYEEDD